MSSFLQVIESNTDVVPPEPPRSLVDLETPKAGPSVPSSATTGGAVPQQYSRHRHSEDDITSSGVATTSDLPLWPMGTGGKGTVSSSLMQEDPAGEHEAERLRRRTKPDAF